MKWRNILLVLVFWGLLGACEKKEIPTFTTDDSGIYFQRVSSSYYGTTTEFYSDSLSFSFLSVEASAKSEVLSTTVRTMGKVVDYDRPFKVEIDQEGTTAVEGKHYEVAFDTMVIPAGKSSAEVQIRFFRTDDLLEKTIRLALRLKDNEYFKCHFPEYKNTNAYTTKGVQIHGDLFAFSLSEMYTEPRYWNRQGKKYLGEWTPKKYLVVNAVCGLSDEDWDNAGLAGAKVTLGRLSFFAIAVQKYLQEQADADTPEVDSDGKYMQLAPAYSVDYSRYE